MSKPALNAFASPPGGKNIVLLFDGTSNTFEDELTNLPALYSLLDADPTKQVCYYQSGIGTYSSYWTPSGLMTGWRKVLDFMVAWDLQSHITDGYEFLMDAYRPGDKIFLFGFSRGAHTARALSGMIQQVGLLQEGNKESIALAYHIYKKKQNDPLYPGELVPQAFKRIFSRDISVHFVGVWDTVASVGAIFPRYLPFASNSPDVAVFRHAYSLDERRARFYPVYWTGEPGANTTSSAETAPFVLPPAKDPKPTDVKEVAFAGCHPDVGGGRFPTDGDIGPRLCHIPLRWLVREAFVHGLRLNESAVVLSPLYGGNKLIAEYVQHSLHRNDPRLDELECLKKNPTEGSKLLVALVHFGASSAPGWMAEEAISGRGDSLSLAIQFKTGSTFWEKIKALPQRARQRFGTAVWWILEVLPTLKLEWNEQGRVIQHSFIPNLGRARTLPTTKPLIFHESVRMRLESKVYTPADGYNVPETKYDFKSKFPKGSSITDVIWEE